MMKNLIFLLLIILYPAVTMADPCPDDVTPPVITSKGTMWDCTFDIFEDSDTNFIEVTEESECGIKQVAIADYDMVRGKCNDPFVKKYTVIWYAEDMAGNSTNFTQEIMIMRPNAGEIVFPKDTMVQCPAGGYENAEMFGYPSINGNALTDLCGFRVKFKLLDTLKSLSPDRCLTEVHKEWSVYDGCRGEVVRDTQEIILIDTIRPIIACSALEPVTRLVIDPETCCAIYNFPEVDAMDFCAPDDELVFRYRIDGTITGSEVALKAGSYEGSVIVTDPCMNADTCHYDIEVVDESDPVFECPFVMPSVELTVSSQPVSVTDLGLTAFDCSGAATLTYRLATQSAGSEANEQTFTCDMVGGTVGIVVLAEDASGNVSEPVSCEVEVTAGANVCPVRRSASLEADQLKVSASVNKGFKAYYNGQDIIVHSETGIIALQLYTVSGAKIWETSWKQERYKYQGSLPGNVKDGVYFLKIEKINDQYENIKMAIF